MTKSTSSREQAVAQFRRIMVWIALIGVLMAGRRPLTHDPADGSSLPIKAVSTARPSSSKTR